MLGKFAVPQNLPFNTESSLLRIDQCTIVTLENEVGSIELNSKQESPCEVPITIFLDTRSGITLSQEINFSSENEHESR